MLSDDFHIFSWFFFSSSGLFLHFHFLAAELLDQRSLFTHYRKLILVFTLSLIIIFLSVMVNLLTISLPRLLFVPLEKFCFVQRFRSFICSSSNLVNFREWCMHIVQCMMYAVPTFHIFLWISISRHGTSMNECGLFFGFLC